MANTETYMPEYDEAAAERLRIFSDGVNLGKERGHKAGYQEGYSHGYLRGQADQMQIAAALTQHGITGAAPGIDPQRLRQLLNLCHPDKHGDSTTAVEVTQWLLALREPKL